jgi:hypothetical protein
MKKDPFGTLRMLGKIYELVAGIGLVCGVLALGNELLSLGGAKGEAPPLLKIALIAIATFLHVVVFYGLSQAIRLLFRIDERAGIAAAAHATRTGPARRDDDADRDDD